MTLRLDLNGTYRTRSQPGQQLVQSGQQPGQDFYCSSADMDNMDKKSPTYTHARARTCTRAFLKIIFLCVTEKNLVHLVHVGSQSQKILSRLLSNLDMLLSRFVQSSAVRLIWRSE